MNTYCYVLKLIERLYDVTAWTQVDEEAVNNHFLRIKKDYETGKIIHVGRTINDNFKGFGLVVFTSEDILDATNYMNQDPAIKGGQMTGSVFEYKHIF
jgi:uncharacterized protein YciI